MLAGLVFCTACGKAMAPSYASKKGRQRYRYYLSPTPRRTAGHLPARRYRRRRWNASSSAKSRRWSTTQPVCAAGPRGGQAEPSPASRLRINGAARHGVGDDHEEVVLDVIRQPGWEHLPATVQTEVLHRLVRRIVYDGTAGTVQITFQPHGIQVLALKRNNHDEPIDDRMFAAFSPPRQRRRQGRTGRHGTGPTDAPGRPFAGPGPSLRSPAAHGPGGKLCRTGPPRPGEPGAGVANHAALAAGPRDPRRIVVSPAVHAAAPRSGWPSAADRCPPRLVSSRAEVAAIAQGDSRSRVTDVSGRRGGRRSVSTERTQGPTAGNGSLGICPNSRRHFCNKLSTLTSFVPSLPRASKQGSKASRLGAVFCTTSAASPNITP